MIILTVHLSHVFNMSALHILTDLAPGSNSTSSVSSEGRAGGVAFVAVFPWGKTRSDGDITITLGDIWGDHHLKQ